MLNKKSFIKLNFLIKEMQNQIYHREDKYV